MLVHKFWIILNPIPLIFDYYCDRFLLVKGKSDTWNWNSIVMHIHSIIYVGPPPAPPAPLPPPARNIA